MVPLIAREEVERERARAIPEGRADLVGVEW